MKQHLLKLRVLFAFILMMIGANAMAKDFTYDFSTAIPKDWKASVNPNGFETTGSSRGCQFAASANLTLAGAKNVTKIVITCSSNYDKNTIAFTVGGKALGEAIKLAKETDVEKTFTGATLSGDIVLAITRTDKSVYIKKIVVTADEIGSSTGGGEEGGDEGDDSTLNPNYNYAEPTTITPSGETCSNQAYSFIQNNIKVETSTGAQYATYFGCNAGNSITFTATKEIRGVVINGYVKKDFTATCNNGDIEYVDATEDEVTANPVVVIYDVNAKSVTIECVKQMRCYSVDFYFNDNPDVEIEGGGGGSDDDEYNYEWEPTTPTTLNITFTDVEAEDYSDYFGFDYTDIYFENDAFSMELAVFAPMVEGTILAPGTYVINDSYEPGTVQASPGGDDMYDYPAYIATDYEEIDGEYYYNTAYYIVSGTLTVNEEGGMVLNGKTHFGSTVHATYGVSTDGINKVEDTKAEAPVKKLVNGRIIISRSGKQYNVNGQRIK